MLSYDFHYKIAFLQVNPFTGITMVVGPVSQKQFIKNELLMLQALFRNENAVLVMLSLYTKLYTCHVALW